MGPLALLEALDRDGMVRQAWRIERWPVTIGRALDNDVVLTEPHVAPHHATIDLVPAAEDGGAASLVVTAGATHNGVNVGRQRIAGGASLHASSTPAATSTCTSAAPRCGCACPGMRWRPS